MPIQSASLNRLTVQHYTSTQRSLEGLGMDCVLGSFLKEWSFEFEMSLLFRLDS